MTILQYNEASPMKTATCFLLCLTASLACARLARAQSKSPAIPTAASAPSAASSVDKVKLEAYLRNLELWPPQVNVSISDPTPAAELPGFAVPGRQDVRRIVARHVVDQ